MEVELNFQSAANFYFFFIKFSYISQKEQPRSCGEYRSSLLSLGLVQGTPLHARGIRWPGCDCCSDEGVIPACAGNAYGV